MSLLTRTHLAAVYQPGRTAMGHHWQLVDPTADDAPVGSTRRLYKNAMFRAVTLTGMDGGNDVRAEVRDGDEPVARLLSRWQTRPDRFTVELTDVHGEPIGSTDHDKEARVLRLLDPHGTEVGRLDHSGEEPWPVLDAAGTRIAVVARDRLRTTAYSLIDDLVFDHGWNEHQRAWEATMFTGIRSARRYEVVIDPAAGIVEPLRTLVVLLPVLAGHSYG